MMETGFKMPYEFALSIGESFAELLGYSAESPEPFLQNRWYLPRKSLTDGLKENLKSAFPEGSSPTPIRIRVATSAVERILSQNQGRSPAVIVNSGFEGAWNLTGSEDRALPAEKDFFFGLSGRMASDGRELAALKIDELEQIAAKLELLKVKDVAIVFLHAKINPAHEVQTSKFFQERGFRTVMSHKVPAVSALDILTIEAAFAESAVIEEKEQIEAALKSFHEDESRWMVVGHQGVHPWKHYSASLIRGGLHRAFESYAATHSAQLLHCGLDEFRVFPCSPGSSSKAKPLCISRRVRPTQLIAHGDWPFPYLKEKACGYAPGPMLFGKSQMLAALDVLFACQHLKEVPGLTPLVNEKSRARILEAIFTLAKSSDTSTKRLPEPATIAQSLERAFIEQITALIQISNSGESKSTVTLTGPLAETIRPHLTKRRPDLNFEFKPIHAWCEAHTLMNQNLSEDGVTQDI